MYATLSGSNQLLLRVDNEASVLNDICKIIVEKSGFKMSWVGLIDIKSNKVKPISSCGNVDGYLDNLDIIVNPELPQGRGPTARAILEERIIVNNDTSKNTDMAPWRTEALKRGYNASASLPIKKENKIIGTLTMYSDKVGFFDEKEVELLEELRNDIAFMLAKIENEKWMNIFYSAIENSEDWMLITDSAGKIIYVNRGVEKISKWAKDELIGKSPGIFRSGLHDEAFYGAMRNKINSGEIFEDFFIDKDRNGNLFYLNMSIIPILGKTVNGENGLTGDSGSSDFANKGNNARNKPVSILNFVAIAKDITENVELEEKFKMLSLYDPLTGLPNRNLFLGNVDGYLKREKAGKKYAAVAIIDLYRLSYFNSTYGYEIGDRIIKSYAGSLVGALRGGDMAARVGADEFGVFFENINEKDDILDVLEKLMQSLSLPVIIADKENTQRSFNISFNAGIAIFPDDGENAADLFKAADIAIISSKNKGENEFVFYKAEMNLKAAESLSIRESLIGAFKNEEFIVYYQPYFDVLSGKICGMEALSRWDNKRPELLPPAKFIPSLEHMGLIRNLEEYLTDSVCKTLSENGRSGLNVVPVSINISPVSFRKEGLLEMILAVIGKYGIDRSLLNIEITESLFLDDFDYAIGVLNKFKENGIKIFIDDFGTGYSSLSYIKNIPADVIKIDISFIRSMMHNSKDLIIVSTITELAKKLGLKTISEGVETEEQFEKLKTIGVDMVQGFLFSKPAPEFELARFLKPAR
jgi:diguanylate cyclase (GGDEF)-like protein/PAS domain S-box-containing protein